MHGTNTTFFDIKKVNELAVLERHLDCAAPTMIMQQNFVHHDLHREEMFADIFFLLQSVAFGLGLASHSGSNLRAISRINRLSVYLYRLTTV